VLAGTAAGERPELSWQQHHLVAAGKQIVSANQSSRRVFVLCGGWGVRSLQLGDGRRQILSFLLPGDLFSAASIFEERPHYSVKAVTAIQISEMDRDEVQSRLSRSPEGLKAFAKTCASEIAHLDELATALGNHTAEERIAYLLLRLAKRISAQSVIHDQRFPIPLRQQHIADATGLTAVHVSRILGALRSRGVLELSDGYLRVINPSEFAQLGSVL